MSLNPTEWTAAQEMLLELVTVLSDDKSRNVPSLARRLNPFTNSTSNDAFTFGKKPIPHSVRLLPVLQTAQNKMTRWIEDLSKDKLKKAVAEDASSTHRAGEASSLGEIGTPVASKAHKLIEQVRVAIQTLSASSYLENPHPAPLRAALMRLKPLVDALIEALSQNEPRPKGRGL